MPDILTYEQLINETDSEKVYLAEIEPAMRMTGWTLTPGNTHTYQVSTDPGMVVVRLKQEKTDLAEKTSITEVESAPGSWFFDSAAEILYVHTMDAAAPMAHYLTAYFLEVFATHPRVFNNRFYQPKIARIPEFRQSINDRNAGDTIQSSGRLVMLEESGRAYWSRMLYRYNWLNKRVVVKLGGAHKGYPYTEFRTVARWFLKGNAFSDSGVDFEVADLKSLFKTQIGLAQFDLTTYPNLEPSADGKAIPIAFGKVLNAQPVNIDFTAGVGGKWKLSAGPIYSIDVVYDNGTAIAFTPDLANGEFTLNAAPQGGVTADFTGIKDGATWLHKGGEISKYLLRNYLALTDQDLVLTDFALLDAVRNFTLGIYIDRTPRVGEILSMIEKSCHCFFSTDRETGKIRVRIYQEPNPADSGKAVLNSDNLFDFSVETEDNLAYEVNVSYAKDQDSGESRQVSRVNLQSGYINDNEEGINVETYLVYKADAEALADILIPFHSKPRLVVKAETHIKPLDRNLYDNFEIDRAERPVFPDQQYLYRAIGMQERAAKNKKRVGLMLARNLQPGE